MAEQEVVSLLSLGKAAELALVRPLSPGARSSPSRSSGPQVDSIPPQPSHGGASRHSEEPSGSMEVIGPPRTDPCTGPKRVQFRTIRGSGPLPSISVELSLQDIAKTVDPAKIKEQLRHAKEQLELTRSNIPVGDARSHAARSLRVRRAVSIYVNRSTGPLPQRTMEYDNAPVLALCC